MDDRRVEALREVRCVPRRAALLGIRREPELVVRDDVERAAGAVAVDGLEVEGLGHDSLGGKGGVAVDEHRHDHGGVVRDLASVAARLVGARAPLDDRIDELEVARVGRERDAHALAVPCLVGARRAVVVLHVAGPALGDRGVCLEVRLALELDQDRLIALADGVGEHVQPPAVRHAQDDLARARVGRELNRLVEHRHEHVEALDRELLASEKGLVQVVLEGLDLR